MLQAGRSRVRIPMRYLNLFSWPNPSNRDMAMGFTQPLPEILDLSVGKARPACKAVNITAIYEPIV
jgi:hypothetical protein